MKYIMLQVDLDGQPLLIPIIFPKFMIHKFVASYMKGMLERVHGWIAVPVAAGEISIFGTEIHCFGESETLKLKARESDAAVIHNYEYNHGVHNPWMDAILKKALDQKGKQ